MPAGYVGMSITPEAREAVRLLTYSLTGRLRRKVEISEAIIAACKIADVHLDSVVAILADSQAS